MLSWKHVSPGAGAPDLVHAIIECPKKTQNKYEMCKHTGLLRLDRVLHSSVMFPQDYGFIPGTLASDGDPLDILVIINNPTFPGILVHATPVGVLMMEDEKGIDEKILSVANHDPFFNSWGDLGDVPRHVLDEIQEFFRTYKNLEEPKYAAVKGWGDKRAAREIIEASIARFKDTYGDVATVEP